MRHIGHLAGASALGCMTALALIAGSDRAMAFPEYWNQGGAPRYYDPRYAGPPDIVAPPRPRIHKFKRRNPEVETERQARKVTAPAGPKGPLLISVSLDRQQLTVYDDGKVIAQSPVSTGKPGHPTPLGVFSVIQKERFHRSNLYSAAPMPFMQRITWSGVALHAGVVPGYPASHGCIRLPSEFAVRLWGTTKVGARVVIARNEIVPQDFAHPRLFVRRDRADIPVAAVPMAPAKSAESATEPAKAVEPAEVSVGAINPVEAHASASPIAVPSPAVPNASVPSADDPTIVEHGVTEPNIAEPKPVESGSAEAKPAEAKPAEAKRVEPAAEAAEQAKPQESAPAAVEPNDVIKIKDNGAISPRLDLRTTLDGVKDDPLVHGKPIKMAQADKTPIIINSPEIAPGRPADTRAAEVYGPPKPLRPGPISVFISKKEARLFVRKGFEPVFDAPVKIDGEAPFGTHVFTAMNFLDDQSTLHWSVLTLPMPPASKMVKVEGKNGKKLREEAIGERPPAPAPGAVLDRISIPRDALDRIQELMSPGASLTVSDQGLGPETGRETDFIVLTR